MNSLNLCTYLQQLKFVQTSMIIHVIIKQFQCVFEKFIVYSKIFKRLIKKTITAQVENGYLLNFQIEKPNYQIFIGCDRFVHLAHLFQTVGLYHVIVGCSHSIGRTFVFRFDTRVLMFSVDRLVNFFIIICCIIMLRFALFSCFKC